MRFSAIVAVLGVLATGAFAAPPLTLVPTPAPGIERVQRSAEPPITGPNCPPRRARSPGTQARAQTTFVNGNNFTISLYWVDFDGNSVHYGDIAPRRSLVLQSYVGHLWVALDRNGRCLGYSAVPAGQPTLAF